MMWPPADSMRALNHTVSDSARRPCALSELLLVLRRLDQLVPGDRLGHVQPRGLGDRLAVPEQLGVGPERDRDELVVPGRRLEGARDDALADLARRRRRAPARGSRPGRARGRTATSRLMRSIESSLAASRRTSCSRCASAVAGQQRGLDRVRRRSRRRCTRAAILAWPAAVGVDVPGQRRRPAGAAAAAGGERAGGDESDRGPGDPAAPAPRPARRPPGLRGRTVSLPGASARSSPPLACTASTW